MAMRRQSHIWRLPRRELHSPSVRKRRKGGKRSKEKDSTSCKKEKDKDGGRETPTQDKVERLSEHDKKEYGQSRDSSLTATNAVTGSSSSTIVVPSKSRDSSPPATNADTGSSSSTIVVPSDSIKRSALSFPSFPSNSSSIPTTTTTPPSTSTSIVTAALPVNSLKISASGDGEHLVKKAKIENDNADEKYIRVNVGNGQ
eukprot:Awhi_evm1s9160